MTKQRKVTVSDTSGVYHYLEAYHPNEWTVEIKYQIIGDHVSIDDVLLPLTDDEIEAGVEATSVINLPGMLEWADETAQYYEDTQTL